MPVLDGYRATAAIRAAWPPDQPPLPIVALTANAMDDDRRRCLIAGMDDFLSKPFSIAQLAETLGWWRRRGGGVDMTRILELRAIDPTSTGFVNELISMFLARTPEALTQMLQALERRDLAAVRQLAHGLRSTSATMGVVALAEACERIQHSAEVDGDGIAARTLPGVGGKGAYFVRGSGHDKHAAYTEDSDAYLELVDRLKRKIDGAANAVPAPIVTRRDGADIGLITIGACDAAVREAADILAAQGTPVNVMRIRGFPFSHEVSDFIAQHGRVFVIEQNRDAQLRALLTIELGVPRDSMIAVLDYGGMPLTPKVVVDAVASHLAGVSA